MAIYYIVTDPTPNPSPTREGSCYRQSISRMALPSPTREG